jgi:hypothetical protein
MSVAADGYLYVTANQLHRQPAYREGKDEQHSRTSCSAPRRVSHPSPSSSSRPRSASDGPHYRSACTRPVMSPSLTKRPVTSSGRATWRSSAASARPADSPSRPRSPSSTRSGHKERSRRIARNRRPEDRGESHRARRDPLRPEIQHGRPLASSAHDQHRALRYASHPTRSRTPGVSASGGVRELSSGRVQVKAFAPSPLMSHGIGDRARAAGSRWWARCSPSPGDRASARPDRWSDRSP